VNRLGVLALAVAGVIVLVLVATLGLTGARSTRGHVEPETPTVTNAPRQSVVTPDVTLRAGASELEPPPAVGGVEDGDVLVVRAVGFPESSAGTIAVCAGGRCRTPFPVNFDSEGRATVQYRVELNGSRCTRDVGCRLDVHGDDRAAVAVLTSGAAPDRPAGRFVGSAALAPGQEVRLVTPGLEDDQIRVLGCGRGAELRSECRDLPVRDRRVAVPRGVERLVLIDAATALPIAPSHQVNLVGLRPSYDSVRLVLGFLVGGVLLGAALLLGRRTDWREPSSVTVWAD
jgi:hypothetical protein